MGLIERIKGWWGRRRLLARQVVAQTQTICNLRAELRTAREEHARERAQLVAGCRGEVEAVRRGWCGELRRLENDLAAIISAHGLVGCQLDKLREQLADLQAPTAREGLDPSITSLPTSLIGTLAEVRPP